MRSDAPEVAGRFLYYDTLHTHEILTDVVPHGAGWRLTILEAPYGSRESRDAVTREEDLDEAWEVALAIRDLEARLAASGVRYVRVASDTGETVAVPFLAKREHEYEPREVTINDPDGNPLAVRYNHYHRHDGTSRLQIAVPRVDLPVERFALADLDFRFSDPAASRVALVHARLAPGTLRQRWVDAHRELSQRGFRRLVTEGDYAAAYGADWKAAWEGAWRVALARFLDADLSRDAPPVPEVAEEAEGDDPGALRAVLASPKLVALKRSYVSDEAEENLMTRGEFHVRRFIKSARTRAGHDEQHALSLVEAALLTRYGFRHRDFKLVKVEGRRVMRLLQDYAPDAVPFP